MQTARASYQYDPRTEATPQSEPAIVLTAAESRVGHGLGLGLRGPFATGRQWRRRSRRELSHPKRRQPADSPDVARRAPAPRRPWDLGERQTGSRRFSGTDPAAGELAVDLPADLKFVTLVLRFSTRRGAFGNVQSPATAAAGHWTAGIRAALAVGTSARLCHVQLRPRSTGRRSSFSLRRCLLGCLGRSEEPIGLQPFASRRLAIGVALAEDGRPPCRPWRRTSETAGWTQFPIDLADGTSTVSRGPPRRDRRRGLDALSGHGRHRGLGPFRPPSARSCLLAVVLGLPALLLPAAISAIFSHGLLGVMFCLVLGLVRRRDDRDWLDGL